MQVLDGGTGLYYVSDQIFFLSLNMRLIKCVLLLKLNLQTVHWPVVKVSYACGMGIAEAQ